MNLALELAHHASQRGEVPVGAIVVHNNQIVGTGYNRREELQSPIAHAEILALERLRGSLGTGGLQSVIFMSP